MNNPKEKPLVSKRFACLLGLLLLLVSWSVVLLVFMKARWMRSGKWSSSANACINNLRQIDAAANEFALEHSLTNGAPIHFPNDLTPYIKLNSAGKIPGCPQGGIYSIQRVGDTPTCSLGSNVTPGHYLP
jgi:hypothetical protein